MNQDEGSNSHAELKRLAERLGNVLDQIAEHQEDVKAIRQAARSSGFTVRALNQVVKEMRRGAAYQAAQLELELELDTYRAAVGLPQTLDVAQQAVTDAALTEDA